MGRRPRAGRPARVLRRSRGGGALLNPSSAARPPPPQISAITPFQIVSALVFGWTVYGMAGLRQGAEPVFRSGLINTLMYLVASQVRGAPPAAPVAAGRAALWGPPRRGASRRPPSPSRAARRRGALGSAPHRPPPPRPRAPRPVQVLHCCAVVAPNQDVAFMLSILWTAIQLLLSGFFINFIEARGVAAWGASPVSPGPAGGAAGRRRRRLPPTPAPRTPPDKHAPTAPAAPRPL